MAEMKDTLGHIHPISTMTSEIVDIFDSMGFSFAEGPEIESEHYNFNALNIPADHPARDMWDTFWLEPKELKRLLRTHTSPVQIRHLEEKGVPARIIVPGKVYRNEATDATHEAQFYQVEGLVVDRDITLAHMKGVLEEFFSKFFGDDIKIRLRPGYFPFVEPGVEVDISCFKCKSSGCALCKQTGWIEIMGAGMVHPNVFKAVNIDSNEWQGFAFGVGMDRLAMFKYGIDDVRLLYSGDLRFVNQF
jgi:phenylalanyl-tRNA synthetase alpha chain